MKTNHGVILCLVTASCAVAADTSTQHIPLTELPAPYVTLGNLVVTIEGTTFKNLMFTVGDALNRTRATPLQDGDGRVCFAYSNIEVRFEASIMAAPGQFTDFSIDAVEKPDARCIALPTVLQPARAGGWLEIGLSREAVEHRFKTPRDASSNLSSYVFRGTFPLCTVEVGGFSAKLEIIYTANRVTHISGSQLTSC